jgi:hypothetical protein
MMYSCKSINSATIPAIKQALNIPDTVAIGIQYRTIADANGKKPPFNKDNPPAAAIHLDIEWRSTENGPVLFISNRKIHD